MIIKHKKIGVSLLELMLVVSFVSIIGSMLYKVFLVMQKTSLSLKETSYQATQLSLSLFNLRQDLMYGSFLHLDNLYESAGNLFKEKDNKDELKNKEIEEKNKKIFDNSILYLIYFKKNNEEYEWSFISERHLLTNKEDSYGPSKITYKLEKNKKHPDSYKLIRLEELMFSNLNKSKPKPYVLINRIEKPIVQWYIPEIKKKTFQDIKIEELEKKIQELKNNTPYLLQEANIEYTPENILENNIFPKGLFFSGLLISTNGKAMPFDVFIDIPTSKYSIEYYLIKIEESIKQQKKSTLDHSVIDKEKKSTKTVEEENSKEKSEETISSEILSSI